MKDYNDLTARLRSAAVEEGMERRQLLLSAAGAIDALSRSLEQAIDDLASGIECCDYCAHSGKEYDPECDAECEQCSHDCPCKSCLDNRNVRWKGDR